MGLDAFVTCNCWKIGKCAPPPVPIIWEEGWAVPANPEQRHKNPFERTPEEHDLENWQTYACEHELMRISERLSNWGGLGLFRKALAKTCDGKLEFLNSKIPSNNGGWVMPEDSVKCLAELELFIEKADFGLHGFLINTETNDILEDSVI